MAPFMSDDVPWKDDDTIRCDSSNMFLIMNLFTLSRNACSGLNTCNSNLGEITDGACNSVNFGNVCNQNEGLIDGPNTCDGDMNCNRNIGDIEVG